MSCYTYSKLTVRRWLSSAISCRVRDPLRLATKYDLVVTTYATLASDYGKNGSTAGRSPLQDPLQADCAVLPACLT